MGEQVQFEKSWGAGKWRARKQSGREGRAEDEEETGKVKVTDLPWTTCRLLEGGGDGLPSRLLFLPGCSYSSFSCLPGSAGTVTRKSLSRTPPDFWQQALVYDGLLEYGLKFGEHCSQSKKTAIKKRQRKKCF
jgi:hypothetical protein